MYVAPRFSTRHCQAAIACGLALVLALPTGAVDLSQPGPHLAGWTEISVPRPGGGSFTAVFFYPATTAGSGGTYDPAAAPYPAISFGHGFLQAVEKYQSTLEHLVSWGYFVIATRSQGGLFPSHAQYAEDLSACLTWLTSENADPASPLYNQVDTAAFGMSGHSMGGGANILATASDPRVIALANLAAAETNPSAISASANITVPLRLISGSEDGIVPVASNGQLMYDAAVAVRQLPLILGGYHCGFIDSDSIFCDSGSITRAQQLAVTRQLLTEFFNLYLKGDQTLWRQVWGPELDVDPLVTTQSDPNITLTPSTANPRGTGGETVTTTLTVTNTGPAASAFTFWIEDNSWSVFATPALTATLPPGGTANTTIEIQIPPGSAAAEDAFLVSACSELDGGTRAFSAITAGRIGVCPGDADCDGAITFVDIEFFVAALTGEQAWVDYHLANTGQAPICPYANNDVDGSGSVDFSDITPFVNTIGTGCP
jgi:dienelactone hydrolase